MNNKSRVQQPSPLSITRTETSSSSLKKKQTKVSYQNNYYGSRIQSVSSGLHSPYYGRYTATQTSTTSVCEGSVSPPSTKWHPEDKHHVMITSSQSYTETPSRSATSPNQEGGGMQLLLPQQRLVNSKLPMQTSQQQTELCREWQQPQSIPLPLQLQQSQHKYSPLYRNISVLDSQQFELEGLECPLSKGKTSTVQEPSSVTITSTSRKMAMKSSITQSLNSAPERELNKSGLNLPSRQIKLQDSQPTYRWQNLSTLSQGVQLFRSPARKNRSPSSVRTLSHAKLEESQKEKLQQVSLKSAIEGGRKSSERQSTSNSQQGVKSTNIDLTNFLHDSIFIEQHKTLPVVAAGSHCEQYPQPSFSSSLKSLAQMSKTDSIKMDMQLSADFEMTKQDDGYLQEIPRILTCNSSCSQAEDSSQQTSQQQANILSHQSQRVSDASPKKLLMHQSSLSPSRRQSQLITNSNFSHFRRTDSSSYNEVRGGSPSNSRHGISNLVTKQSSRKVLSNPISILDVSTMQQTNCKERTRNLKSIVRFRPENKMEQELSAQNLGQTIVSFVNSNSLVLSSDSSHVYTFDKDLIYEEAGREVLIDVLAGYNGTIFAYGVTGSGKTHTMFGKVDLNTQGGDLSNERGIIPRIAEEVFLMGQKQLQGQLQGIPYGDTVEDFGGGQTELTIYCSMLEIYKEQLFDSFARTATQASIGTSNVKSDIKIKESKDKGIYVHGLSRKSVASREELMELIVMGYKTKRTRETKLNEYSSRSHTIFTIEVMQRDLLSGDEKQGRLNLVDLAGAEKVSRSGAQGESLEEAIQINLSLSSLGNVIHALANAADHIPFRDSKLTRILQESLHGNYKVKRGRGGGRNGME